jgi:pimeloyl-ACP methyl ester carboxylesterase
MATDEMLHALTGGMRRAFHLQSMSLFRDAAEYIRWLRAIRAPVLIAAGNKDVLTPLVRYIFPI